MRHVAAYMLCVLGGNESPSAADVKKVVESFGAEVDSDRVDLLVKELEGKNLEEVIDAGKAKLETVSVGAATGGAAAGGAAGGEAAAEEAAAEEEEEEMDLGGGMDMFGGGEDY